MRDTNKSKKKKQYGMKSIARKISLHWNIKQMRDFLFLDLVFAVGKIYLWMVFTEAGVFNKKLFSFSNLFVKGKFSYEKANDIEQFFSKIFYEIPGCDEKIFAGNMAGETFILLLILLLFELAVTLTGFAKGGKTVREKLSPLNQLAMTTKMISESDFKTDKFVDLEKALDEIDTDSTDNISTGNTELEGIENAINSLIKRMKTAYEQQTRFVSDASHELRTPLSVITGYTNMLDRWGKDDPKILEEAINAIKSESEGMKRLIEQLLFLARGDNGRTQLQIEKIDLNELMKVIYDEYVMVDSTHKFVFREESSVEITGDYDLIKQTARILADNAVKYTPEGGEIIFTVKDDDGIPAFEVQDSGIGIKSEDIPKVFERFFRADDARNRKTGGTGLGLSIAKWIVDKHGGYFKITSFEDIGTKFTVLFPENLENDETDNEQNV